MNILTIAVHPDDETLGCGATLLKHRAQGARIHWLLVTSAQSPEFSASQIERARDQIEQVRAAYPFDGFHWLELPTTRLDALPISGLIERIRSIVEQVRPETIYVPNRSDVHSDHRVVFDACMAVVKTFYMQLLGVRRVLACEVASETDAAPALAETAFLPTVFVDVTDTFERKLELMSLYLSELHPEPMPRSLSAIRAQGRVRGATMGVTYAEAFMLLRELS